jgi:hypothetical protein
VEGAAVAAAGVVAIVAAASVDLAVVAVAVAVPVVVGNLSKTFMKHFLILAIIFSQIFSGMAQQMKLPVGKKYTITNCASSLLEFTVMDSHIQKDFEVTMKTLLEVTAVNPNGYTFKITPFHMKMGFSLNGVDQKIDTDSAAIKSNPEYAKLYEMLDHPQLVEVAQNKMIKNSLQSILNPTGIQEDYGKYCLDISNVNLHNGYAWTDSITNETGKILHQYIIMQITDSLILVNVNTDYEEHITVEKAGTKIIQNLNGFSTAKRTYWKQNRLLNEEKMELSFSGSTETNELTAPITIKSKTTTLVQ